MTCFSSTETGHASADNRRIKPLSQWDCNPAACSRPAARRPGGSSHRPQSARTQQTPCWAYLLGIVVRGARPSATLKPIEAEELLLSDSSPVNIPLRRPFV